MSLLGNAMVGPEAKHGTFIGSQRSGIGAAQHAGLSKPACGREFLVGASSNQVLGLAPLGCEAWYDWNVVPVARWMSTFSCSKLFVCHAVWMHRLCPMAQPYAFPIFLPIMCLWTTVLDVRCEGILFGALYFMRSWDQIARPAQVFAVGSLKEHQMGCHVMTRSSLNHTRGGKVKPEVKSRLSKSNPWVY